MAPEAIDNSITEILNQFANSNLQPLENINTTLDLFEILRDRPEHFTNCLRAVGSGDRQQVKEAVFFANHKYLSDRILENPALTHEDANHIITDVARQLPNYDGNRTELGFRAWLDETTKPLISFYSMKRQYSRSVLAGIWSVLRGCGDLGIEFNTVQDLASRVWTKIYLHLDDWLQPGRAVLSTRLYAAGRYEARAWRTTRLRERDRFATLDEYQKIEEGLAKPRRTAAQKFELAKAVKEAETIQ